MTDERPRKLGAGDLTACPATSSGADTTLDDDQRPELTIVVPAYNESARLPRTLSDIDQFIATRPFSVELLVVDDGSDDDTCRLAQQHPSTAASYQVLRLPHRGKASAVRAGVLAASGRHVLFTDADLSTPIDYATKLTDALDAGADVAIGSREGIGATRVGEPSYRHVMGRVFNAVVRLLAVPGINDTQCGFKAFQREAAQAIFTRTILHAGDGVVDGPRVTGFDVEVLYVARRLGYTIAEVPVYWEHVVGSKVQPLPDSFRMFADVLRVRWNAIRGRYH
ncbi:MAG TPA: dolichyl-phosphate beta-glucosyltransferase [Thermomicrobiales bacterium]|nr:dolichyl-phosphate beta-glucosyltransferase [Thermomicrobiales bacterium]